jgi:hypothetical protein
MPLSIASLDVPPVLEIGVWQCVSAWNVLSGTGSSACVVLVAACESQKNTG